MGNIINLKLFDAGYFYHPFRNEKGSDENKQMRLIGVHEAFLAQEITAIRERGYQHVILAHNPVKNEMTDAQDQFFVGAICAPLLGILQSHLSNELGFNCQVLIEPFSKSDVFSNHQNGGCKSAGESYAQLLRSYPDANDEGYSKGVHDQTKILQLYALAHRTALFNPQAIIDIDVYETNTNTLAWLKSFFLNANELLPANINQLRLHHKNGESYCLFNRVDETKAPALIDSNYIWTVRYMAALGKVQSAEELVSFHNTNRYDFQDMPNLNILGMHQVLEFRQKYIPLFSAPTTGTMTAAQLSAYSRTSMQQTHLDDSFQIPIYTTAQKLVQQNLLPEQFSIKNKPDATKEKLLRAMRSSQSIKHKRTLELENAMREDNLIPFLQDLYARREINIAGMMNILQLNFPANAESSRFNPICEIHAIAASTRWKKKGLKFFGHKVPRGVQAVANYKTVDHVASDFRELNQIVDRRQNKRSLFRKSMTAEFYQLIGELSKTEFSAAVQRAAIDAYCRKWGLNEKELQAIPVVDCCAHKVKH